MANVPNKSSEPRLMPMGEVARRVGFSDTMARRYFDAGAIQGIRLANNERLAWADSVEMFIERRSTRS